LAAILIIKLFGNGFHKAIVVASCLKNVWPVLVITPSALRLQWALMIEQWLKIRSSEILVVMSQWAGSNIGNLNIVQTSSKQIVRLDGVFNIISYELVSKLQEILVNSDFKIVIADESHYMKNPQAKRTNACIPLFRKAQYRILLSGTPALSRPIEILKQLEALYPTVYKDVHQYGSDIARVVFWNISRSL
jgi:SWI/SNF-related matrix-associated actin-dependent regulator 1 of chromatin subfamily A